jgi:hypothetical protein
MGCCGQKREALTRRLSVTSTRPTTFEVIEPPSADATPPLRLHYLQSRPLLVRGPVTGRVYQFSGAHPDSNVDSRDADALLRTHLFRQAG